MRAVVRKERKRKMEDPPKDSVFRVRKHHVDSSKIERFKRDKGIDENDNNVSMLDAGTSLHLQYMYQILLMASCLATPSEISCYTPQPENDETSAQGTGIVSDSGSWSHLSAVQYRTMPNNSCYNRPNLPFGLTLIDPPLSSAETALSASSSYPSYTTSDNKIDSFVNLVQTTDEPDLPIYKWFESFINHRSRTSTIPSRSLVADLVRRFIEQVDTYQAQRELGVRESIWSTTRKNVHPESEHRRDDCATCKAIGTLHVFQMFAHIRVTHPQRLPYDFDKGFLTSEMIQTLLPALDTVGKDALSNAISAAWIVASGGRFQDVDRVIQATIKELKRRSAWDPMRKKRFDLRLANFYISHGRYGEAEQILSDILKNKLPSAARMAATQDVEFFRETYFNSLQEGFLSCRDDKMTDEDLAYIREIMG